MMFQKIHFGDHFGNGFFFDILPAPDVAVEIHVVFNGPADSFLSVRADGQALFDLVENDREENTARNPQNKDTKDESGSSENFHS